MIDRRWLPLNALRAFEAVGRNLSFTAAAQALSVLQGAVSRHVIALEGLLRAPLFEPRFPPLDDRAVRIAAPPPLFSRPAAWQSDQDGAAPRHK